MFINDVVTNVSNIQYLTNAGHQGEFLCVLCGPWESVHLKIVKETFVIRPSLVLAAWQWLKENNIRFKDFVIPDARSLPKPRIVEHKSL